MVCLLSSICVPLAQAGTTGLLSLNDSNGEVAATYQSGDAVYLQVTDPDGNSNASAVDTLTALVTSETEDTGTPFSATAAVPGSSNTGDGTLTILSTSYDTLTEDWSLTAVSSSSFIIVGSVSGNQSQQYNLNNAESYTTSNNEVSFRIEQGSFSFAVGDTFSFSTTSGTVVSESVTLTETGVNTGVFEGSIALAEGSASASNNTLEVNSGDLITAFYNDASGDWGGAVQVRSTSLYSATVIGGSTILADTVWTAANSPYLITGDVTVQSGVTLTILEGVEVLFLANTDDQVAGDEPYDSELIVNGTLNVAGSEVNPVVFTSSNREPLTGDWGGIRINNNGASFDYATIEYSAYGIYANGLSSGQTLAISRSIIQHNGNYGVRNQGYGSNGTVHITDSQIINNNGTGIYSQYSYDDWTITGNTISGNQGVGIYLQYEWDDVDVVVTDNVIEENVDYQARFDYISGDFTFSGNSVSGSSQQLRYENYEQSDSSNSTDSITITDNEFINSGSGDTVYIHDRWCSRCGDNRQQYCRR